jgi:hypothetical protein
MGHLTSALFFVNLTFSFSLADKKKEEAICWMNNEYMKNDSAAAQWHSIADWKGLYFVPLP